MNISVIGLGKLGLCTAACFAAAGHAVYGFDIADSVRDTLKAGGNPVDEPGLTELLKGAAPTLQIVDSYDEAVDKSDVSLIIVPTPSLPDGRFSNEYVLTALHGMSAALKAGDGFHIVDIVSTVMPGTCDSVFLPLLEKTTGKQCGLEFGLVYNPEFIALGSVIRDFLNPDMVLVGASDRRSAAVVQELYSTICKSSPQFSLMSLTNAEITKLGINCYVTMKISYANSLAAVCEQMPGADVDIITIAMGADSRVGGKYLKGGLGFGGPCFPRDNQAFQSFARERGCESPLGQAVAGVNNSIPVRICRKIREHCKPPAKVALLGLSYKADTHVIEESQSIIIAQQLCEAGYRVSVHDPQSLQTAKCRLGETVEYAATADGCLLNASAVLFMTDWPIYRELDADRIAASARPGAVIIDSWRRHRHLDQSGFTYIPLGIGIAVKP